MKAHTVLARLLCRNRRATANFTSTIPARSTFTLFSLLTKVFLALISKPFVTRLKICSYYDVFHHGVYFILSHRLSFLPNVVVSGLVVLDCQVKWAVVA